MSSYKGLARLRGYDSALEAFSEATNTTTGKASTVQTPGIVIGRLHSSQTCALFCLGEFMLPRVRRALVLPTGTKFVVFDTVCRTEAGWIG
ncbi:MAG: hypothetical protein JWL77_6839 [Chthonomonadaceae bacterium]|nr:hypothetical protein [Chthonomonadaceae bacterium]